MISKAQIKLIHSLKLKKYRKKHGLFVVEGEKSVRDLLQSGLKPEHIFLQEGFSAGFEFTEQITEISAPEMKKISFLSTPSKVLALFEIPEYSLEDSLLNNLVLILDEVQDPGNLGTIIRVADWFGLRDIVCSTGTVDVYNPKTVQATMGSIARVKLHYTDLPEYLQKAKNRGFNIYGSFMNGSSIYQTSFAGKKLLVMGNEGNGISPEIAQLVDEQISIPKFFQGNEGPESLNVAMATGIILSEIKRS